MLTKIVSGGQTGVDRAALDAAMNLHFPVGGWCPRRRLAEDGPINKKYPLKETYSTNYAFRTRQNVVDSDGTLIISYLPLTGGTALTLRFAEEEEKPFFIYSLNSPDQCDDFFQWLAVNCIDVLNVAGPRESSCPGIYRQAYAVITHILTNETP